MGQHTPLKIFVHIKPSVYAKPGDSIRLAQVAAVSAPGELEEKIGRMIVTKVPESETATDTMVVDAIKVISALQHAYPEYDIEHLGATDIIVRVTRKQDSLPWRYLKVAVVSLLLFVGAAMTIMNFHADVAMAETQRTVYSIITGINKQKPLALQIPYSLGIGIGMLMFFNHVFKRPLSNEPSPLELEMYLYEESLNQYLRSAQDQSESELE